MSALSPGSTVHSPPLGVRVRQLRKERSWTLEQASKNTGLAKSTLSKIENAQISPTYDALIKIATGMGLGLSELFAPTPTPPSAATGRRSITRGGRGVRHATPYYDHVLLCNELTQKDMVPFRSVITARDPGEFDDWSRHVGEEFVFVLRGSVTLYTEFYEPAELAAGDCWYIDSRMGHKVVSTSPENAEVLWVSTTHPKLVPAQF